MLIINQLISDTGYESEINSVAVASQQVEVFSKVIKTSIGKFVQDGIENQHKNLKDIIVIKNEFSFAFKNAFSFFYKQKRK